MRRKNKVIAKIDETVENAGLKQGPVAEKKSSAVEKQTKKGYNEKNPTQPGGSFPPDSKDEPADKI